MQRLLLICTFLYTFIFSGATMTVHPETAPPCNSPESDGPSLSARATITVHPLSITPSSLVLGATITVHPLSITPSLLVLGATIIVHQVPAPTLLLSLRLSRSFRKGCSPCISKFRCLSNQVGSGLSWHILNLSWCQVCILFWSATRYREFGNARRTKKGPA